jgi:membrane protease YdiL (CAAX protease family)
MDFNFRRPLHIFALILILISLFLIVILPTLTFIGVFQVVEYEEFSESYAIFSEVFLLIFQLVLVFILMIIFPILWYIIVNNCSIKQALLRLRLTLENIDLAFLWAIVATILIFLIFFIINFIFVVVLKFDVQEIGNIEDLTALFSPISLILLVAIQPVAEEIFFRGFLLEKIESFAGGNIAILLTSVLFGLAHAAYNKITPILLPIIMGIILGYVVVKTKNLYSSIIAHVCYNVGVLIFALFAGSLY